MDKRDAAAALGASLPILAALVVERIMGPPLDELLAWPFAPAVLLAVALAFPAILLRARFFSPSRTELQSALDRMIDRIYVLPPADRPSEGLTTEGAVLEHAPENFRAEEYRKLGLPKPAPHKSQYR